MIAAVSKADHDRDQENLLLDWFAKSGAPMKENLFRVGAYSYHQFSSLFQTKTGRYCGVYGRSQDRKAAAIKCAAEFIERKVMLDFFSETGEAHLPSSLHSSNGWAVHFEKETALKKSYEEGLERHLLLRSYLASGWEGFRLVHKVESDAMDLYFLLSCYSADGQVAGLVAAKSPLYPGVSFGYCLGEEKNAASAQFWESGIFEAVDRILTLNGEKINAEDDPKSWLRREAKFYLETPFDFSVFQGSAAASILILKPKHQSLVLDVSERYGIPTPFFAAYSWGDELIPLFHKGTLNESAERYLRDILFRNGLGEIPERHPVL